MVERYGERVVFKGKSYYLFPRPEVIAAAGLQELRAMQFSGKKAEYITGLASLFAEGSISKEKLMALPDFLARQKLLTSIRGIGIWTAN